MINRRINVIDKKIPDVRDTVNLVKNLSFMAKDDKMRTEIEQQMRSDYLSGRVDDLV
jgi:uncharacterized protein YeeX (DUF496 family)